MHYKLLYLICLTSTICFAQKNSAAIIEYKQINNTDGPNSYLTTLFIEGNVSVFQEKYSTTVSNDAPPEEGTVRRRSTVVFDPYLKVDRAKKELFFFEMIGTNIFLVKDTYNTLKWNITTEAKKIAGYNCIKATATYRGRIWVAWFSPEIPLPFGPWKLHGLPGLILEASDTTNRYAYKVVKVEFKKSDLPAKNFSTLMAAHNKTPITYRQYLQDYDEYITNAYKELSQEHNVTLERTKYPRNGPELKYEWEE